MLALLLTISLLGACAGGEGGPDGTEGPPTTVAGGDVDPNAVVIYVAEGSSVFRVAPGTDEREELADGFTDAFQTWALDGSVWVSQTDGRLVRLHPDTGVIEIDIAAGDFVSEIAIGEGFLWVLTGSVGLGTNILKVDPTSGEILATVVPDDGADFSDLAVGEGAVWAVGGDPLTVAALARIDPTTATLTTLIDTGIGPDRVAVGHGSVWVTGGGFLNVDGSGDRAPQLVRIDPMTNQVTSSLTVGEIGGFPDLAVGYESIWLTDTPAGQLVRVNRDGTAIEARIDVGSGGQDLFEIALAKGLVWVGNPFERRVYAVDPSVNATDSGLEGGARGIAFAP